MVRVNAYRLIASKQRRTCKLRGMPHSTQAEGPAQDGSALSSCSCFMAFQHSSIRTRNSPIEGCGGLCLRGTYCRGELALQLAKTSSRQARQGAPPAQRHLSGTTQDHSGTSVAP